MTRLIVLLKSGQVLPLPCASVEAGKDQIDVLYRLISEDARAVRFLGVATICVREVAAVYLSDASDPERDDSLFGRVFGSSR